MFGSRTGRLATALAVLAFSPLASAQVFINEIHYDNDGGDTGEAIEIAGAAGTDLAGWSLVRYNGNGGASYGTDALAGVISNQQGGFGTILIEYPSNGLQNGSPDGIALIDAANNVVQFLSYEGTFAATNGPAAGLTSTDIGVAETSSTPVGFSLQLTGSGTQASDFVWAAPQANTFCAVNTGQTLGDGVAGPGDPCPDPGGNPDDITLVINEVDYDQPSADTAEFIELLNVGTADVDLTGVTVELVNGSNDSVYDTINLPSSTVAPGEYFVICANPANTPSCDLAAISSIQNGGPDGAAIRLGSALIDAISYEGDIPSIVEGSGVGIADSGSIPFVSLSRTPDGIDTDQNNVDFSLRCTTPGATNSPDTTDCDDPVPPIVINEVHADPANDLPGDANNDGVRDFSDDEFVEIVNTSGGSLDISGWTLADGATLRHTFPADTVVPDQCSVVVFGGGVPMGTFGNSLVQTASTGSLGLNNGGDTITINDGAADVVVAGYGSEAGDNQSITRSPDITGASLVRHSTATGSGGALYSPGTDVAGDQFSGCPVPPVGPFEIFEIQGDGEDSPFEGQTVITEGNIVTGVNDEGFSMQTPDSRADGNVDTSDGIYVFTGGAPGVAVGDLVNVTGEVVEFFGFTEFTNSPTVTVISAGLALPTPVALDAATPSPDPTTPTCAIEFECLEGMLISIADGTVTASNQRFGTDPIAEVFITAAPTRSFREPGIEFPGIAGLPVWDGNPEVFELDPDRLGLPNQTIPAGSSFSATGVIGFDFGDYELWPTSLTVNERALPQPVRPGRWFETTVGSLNLFRLFDDVDDLPGINPLGEVTDDFVVSSEEYQRRIDKLALYIVDNMRTPDILAVQEVESEKVLDDLAAAVNAIHPWARYEAYVIEGNDIGGIDVGFMVRKWKVWFPRVEQLGADETYVNPEDGQLDLTHDRPPLLLKGWTWFVPINVMAVHNRSLGGIDEERVQVKRLEQAVSIADKVQSIQNSRGGRALIVLGDFNAFEFSDSYVDAVGTIQGMFDPAENLRNGPDLVDPDLLNQIQSLPPEDRYSFIFRGNAQALDHALTSMALDFRVRGLQFARGNADAAVDLINDETTSLRSSDHDGLVLYYYKGFLKRRRW
ncbi:MAG: lamin tail domain-containing protein [Pseudomonadota bacterium]